MSILKTATAIRTAVSASPSSCVKPRLQSRFIPYLPNRRQPASEFRGQPKPVAISGDIDAFTELVWNSLNEENRFPSLSVISTSLRNYGQNRQQEQIRKERQIMRTFGTKNMDATPTRNRPAFIWKTEVSFRSRIAFGKPGYINFLDAFNGWQLVSGLKKRPSLSGKPTSFKHVSPAGAAVGLPLTETQAKIYWVDDMDWKNFSPLACVPVREARGADRIIFNHRRFHRPFRYLR